MSPHFCLLLAALGLPTSKQSQTRPARATATRTEPDQELDDFRGRYKGIHRFSARLRGVRAAGQTVYWVSSNSEQLMAYHANKQVWSTSVVAPFRAEIPTAHIASIVLTSNIIFVRLGRRGMAELDRKTGHLVAKYFDRDPHNLKAD